MEKYNCEFKRDWIIPTKCKNFDLLSFMTYNILADSLASESLHLPRNIIEANQDLCWNKRLFKIVKELKYIQSDIICLQEFVKDKVFLDEINKMKYDIFMQIKSGVDHGCAILWKNEKFILKESFTLNMNLEYSEINKSESYIYNKTNLCIFVLLQFVNKKKYLIVACTHILFNQKRGDIKLAQVYQIMNCLRLIKNKIASNENTIYTILGGDFNCNPNSGIFKFITEGKLNCFKLDKRKVILN